MAINWVKSYEKKTEVTLAVASAETKSQKRTKLYYPSFAQGIFCNTSAQGGLLQPPLDFLYKMPYKLVFAMTS